MKIGFWSGKRVLVTGAGGFLGSWLAIVLRKKGAHVVGIIRDDTAKSNFHMARLEQEVDTVRGKICDFRMIEEHWATTTFRSSFT